MIINLSPQRRDDTLTIIKVGDLLTINGEQYDFSSLPDGATIRAEDIGCPWLVGDAERRDGKVVLTVLLPHGPNSPQHVAFPSPIIDPPDGEIVLPTSEAFNVDA